MKTMFPVFYFHINMNAGYKLSMPVDETHNAFMYGVKGNLETEGRSRQANQVIFI
ncbi:MAG: hypothetical protein IPI23_21990 [Bacteroidetes bacterium]|nr:hypothetical protein [Bacteroidota bacterium]